MKILLYDYVELEERGAKSYRLWKGCHITSYVLAAVFGLLNFYFLQQTTILFGDQCVLDPYALVFTNASAVPTNPSAQSTNPFAQSTNTSAQSTNPPAQSTNTSAQSTNTPAVPPSTNDNPSPSAAPTTTSSLLASSNTTLTSENSVPSGMTPAPTTLPTVANVKTTEQPPPPPTAPFNKTVEIINLIAINESIRPSVLDVEASQFRLESHCDLPRYTPLLSTIFGIVWCTMFMVCSAGGRSKHGMSEPWRIVVPAMIFALVLVFLTGHGFLATNRGLQALCHGFYNITNTTSCTRAMDAHVASARGAWCTPSAAVGATRAASAGVWACWAAACALLLARCLAAADFALRRTEIHLKDPNKKLVPLLKEHQKQLRLDRSDAHNSAQSQRRSPVVSVALHEESSDSEPTSSTELNTVSAAPLIEVARGKSLNDPGDKSGGGRNGQYIELSYAPQSSSAK